MSWARAALLVVAAGCGPIVDAGGTDTDAPDPSTSDVTATPTTSVGTTVATTTSASSTITTTTASDVTTDTPEPPPPGSVCQGACEQPMDCCTLFLGDPSCVGMLGTYPYNFGCENGVCQFIGCNNDDECAFGGALKGWICDHSAEVPTCQPGCNNDDDCAANGIPGWVCNGTYCEQPPCVDDASCGGGDVVCNPVTGACELHCSSDDVCSGAGVCNLDTGQCGCTASEQCDEGFTCAPF